MYIHGEEGLRLQPEQLQETLQTVLLSARLPALTQSCGQQGTVLRHRKLGVSQQDPKQPSARSFCPPRQVSAFVSNTQVTRHPSCSHRMTATKNLTPNFTLCRPPQL